jgi:hypothetical protein
MGIHKNDSIEEKKSTKKSLYDIITLYGFNEENLNNYSILDF